MMIRPSASASTPSAAPPPLLLQVRNITKRYPSLKTPALSDISLQVREGEIIALAGESGSGKTTLLRIIAGFERSDRGSIVLGEETIFDRRRFVAPEHRRIGMVFQEQALFPHLRVGGNIAFGLSSMTRVEQRQRVSEMVELIGMSGLEGRYPHELSGGQVQRVSIARALAPSPRLILFDEPFNNLDASLCRTLMPEVRSILKRSGMTALFTTHRDREAFTIADKIAIVRSGTLVQFDDPKTLYRSPAGRYVARFFGPINEFRVHPTEEGIETPIGFIATDAVHLTGAGFGQHAVATLLIRPHDIEFFPAPGTPCKWKRLSRFPGQILSAQYFGNALTLRVEVDSGEAPIVVSVDVDPELTIMEGQRVEIGFPHHCLRIIPDIN